jgi:GTP-binding protein
VDGTQEDVAGAYKTVRHELDAYGEGLGGKQEIVALNKIDALTPEELETRKAALEDAAGAEIYAISAAAGAGVQPLLHKLMRLAAATRKAEAPETVEPASDDNDENADDDADGGWTP